MALVAPAGPVYQAGTLSGNPLAMTAGLTMLDILAEAGVYERLERLISTLHDGLAAAARRHGVPVHGTRLGSMGTLFFAEETVTDYASARAASTSRRHSSRRSSSRWCTMTPRSRRPCAPPMRLSAASNAAGPLWT